MKTFRTLPGVIFLLSFSFFLIQLSTAQPSIQLSGEITSDTTLSADTVKVTGDILVHDDAILTIASGTYIEFQGWYTILVEGTIRALGQPGDTIVFTCHPDSTASGWDGIEYFGNNDMANNDSSIFTHCKFEYAKDLDQGGWENIGGAFCIRDYARIRIEDCVFRNNHGGWYAGGVYMYGLSNILIRDCYFINNSGSTGAAIAVLWSSPVVEGNTIIGSSGECAILCNGNAVPVIRNNTISKSDNKGMYIGSSFPVISGNLITNNEVEGIYVHVDADPVIVNNTICNNHWGIISQSAGTYTNNIIWGNNNQLSVGHPNATNIIHYNNIQGGVEGAMIQGIRDTTGNINLDPGFVAPSGGVGASHYSPDDNWTTGLNSPVFNSGTPDTKDLPLPQNDLMGVKRVLYGNIDIGAYEYQRDTVSLCGLISKDTTFFADTIKINCKLTVESGNTWTILPSTVIEFQGNYMIENKGTILAIGEAGDSILFTVKDTAGFHDHDTALGGWGGIYMYAVFEDSSIFEHCIFRYAKAPDRDDFHDAGAVIRSNAVGQSFRVEHCLFEWNIAYVAGAIFLYGDLVMKHCCIRNSIGIHHAGALDIRGALKSVLIGNKFINCDGGAVTMSARELVIKNNVFSNTTGGNALSINTSEKTDLVSNLFCNNSGTAIYSSSITELNIISNTVVNNGYRGIRLTKSNAKIYNSIIWGNSDAQIGINDYQSVSDIIHSCIEGGLSGISGQEYLGNYINNIDHDPNFMDPTGGTGHQFDGFSADWTLRAISPCINSGTAAIEDYTYPPIDLYGNPRIHSSGIDMGIAENQSAAPAIIKHPSNSISCAGDTVLFRVITDEEANYQWLMNDEAIPGATSDQYLINSVTSMHEGNYECRVMNAFDTIYSHAVYLLVRNHPEILSQSTDSWIQPGKANTINVYAGGTNLKYKWYKDGNPLVNVLSPELLIADPDSSDEGRYTCEVYNSCGTVISQPVDLYIAPQLCMVTVSPTTGNNLVVWEKTSGAPILAYNVYRESIAAGIYDKLTSVPHDDLSVYIDTTADPTVQAYIYKVTAVDTAQNESDIDLCEPHKTIHLIVSTNPELNTTQLLWDSYYGFDYQTYTIYRSSTGVNFDPVHSLSASLNSWTDPDPSDGDLFYRIAVEKPVPCAPTGGNKKAESGPFVHSLSNLDDNKLKAGENPPDSIYIDNLSIDENMLPGSLVGRLVTIDVDSLDYYTYQFVPGGGDEDNGSFTLIGDLLVSARTFDYETRNTYNVRIRTTDNAAFYLERAFIIAINDTEEGTASTGSMPPDSLYLDKLWIDENNNFGDPVGVLMTADEDSSDVHSYMLVSGAGDEDNMMFMITGNVLRAGNVFDFEQEDSYSIRVRSTDLAENWIERVFVIIIKDLVENVGVPWNMQKQLSAFPNPFDQYTRVVFPNKSNETFSLILTDLSGKVCRITEGITGSEYVLNKAGLRPGLYFIELKGSKIYRGKLVIE